MNISPIAKLVKRLLELFRLGGQYVPRKVPASAGISRRSICRSDLFLSSVPTGASASQFNNPAALRAKVSLFADLYAKTQELVAQRDLVCKIAHELRGPLTSVIGYVELLIDGNSDVPTADQVRMLTIIDRNSRRNACARP